MNFNKENISNGENENLPNEISCISDYENITNENTNLYMYKDELENITKLIEDLTNQIENGYNDEEDENDEENEENEDEGEEIETINIPEDDYIDMENMIHELIDEYMEMEIENMSSPDFHDNMKKEISEYLFEQWKESGLSVNNYEEIENTVSSACDLFFEINTNIPPRSYKNTFVESISDNERKRIEDTIDKLNSIEQPKQRTEEWYKFRHNIITASNIWKVFGSEAQQNSIIYEKCKPYEIHNDSGYVNINSALHWGNKFEPVTIMLYEDIYNTTVSDFGCILHSEYPFIGASPDGINTDPKSERYGRMIEVKNIVNREITGIPKEEYWIQMQMQMEICNLNECDFIETRFKLYNSEEEFYSSEMLHDHRGVILYFIKKLSDFEKNSNEPYYMYMPLDVSLQKESIDEWIQEIKKDLSDKFSLYETQYWYLDEISVVLVKRNNDWFKKSIEKIRNIWNTIEKERVEGYEHRAVRKKPVVVHDESSTNQIIKNLPSSNNVCLIKLDENGDVI
jgi:putative phage-type endonuclease